MRGIKNEYCKKGEYIPNVCTSIRVHIHVCTFEYIQVLVVTWLSRVYCYCNPEYAVVHTRAKPECVRSGTRVYNNTTPAEAMLQLACAMATTALTSKAAIRQLCNQQIFDRQY